jgi:hypothetical protein
MITDFLLDSDDYVADPRPRECVVLRSDLKSETGQRLIQVFVQPALAGNTLGKQGTVDQLLLGQIDPRLTLAAIGERPFMVDLYVHTGVMPKDIVETKDLVRIGCGLLHKANASANRANSGSTVKTKELEVVDILFIKEQDGIPERELKAKLTSIFDARNVRGSAYLVQVHYPLEDEISIALCFCGMNFDEELVSETGLAFHRMFGVNEHLDTAFLNAEQERMIQKVASPFYEKREVAMA